MPGILDDSNPYRGLRPDDSTEEERLRSSRRIAVASLVLTLMWGFGFLSFGGLLGGAVTLTFLRGHDERLTRRIAQAAVIIGSVGVLVTLVVFGPEMLDQLFEESPGSGP
jgi:fatty acid desaturase